jgi:hypothetical protein
MDSVELQDSDGEQASESIPELRSRVESSGAESILAPSVVQGHVEKCAWEEDCLDNADTEASSHKSTEALDGAHAGRYDTPQSHRGTDIDSGIFYLTEDQVQWDLHQDFA